MGPIDKYDSSFRRCYELKRVGSIVNRSSYLSGGKFCKGEFIIILTMLLESPEVFLSFKSLLDALRVKCEALRRSCASAITSKTCLFDKLSTLRLVS